MGVFLEGFAGGGEKEGQYVWKKYENLLPSGYTPVEHIESTGTQRINTGVIVGNSDFTIRMKVRPMVEVSDANYSVGNWFVTMNPEITSVKGNMLQVGTIKNKFAVHLGMVTDDGTETPTGGVVELTLSVVGNKATLTGNSSYTVTNDYFVSGNFRNYPILICDGKWKAERVEIEVGGVLVRDYLSCKNASGVGGLYDLVNNTFDTNAGTGTFAVGGETNRELTGFVVADDENAYPTDDEQDGYWYEKIEDLTANSIADTITQSVSESSPTITIPHGLGRVPDYYGLRSVSNPSGQYNTAVSVTADATNIKITFTFPNYVGSARNITCSWFAVAIE